MKSNVHKFKEKFFNPCPVFGQLVSLVRQANIERVIQKTEADKYSKKFKTKDQLYTMLVAVICQIKSLRDLCALFHVNIQKLNQLGLSVLPNKSTLSYVNKNRDYRVFESIYNYLRFYYWKVILDSRRCLIVKGLGKKITIIDSTVVGLFSSVMRNTGRYRIDGKKKRGIKLHMSIEEGISLPQLYYISEATVHDQKGMENIKWKKENIYVMDRGYLNYEQFLEMTNQDIYFVSRLKENTVYKSVEEKDIPDDAHNGILKDEIIEKEITTGKDGQKEVIRLRRVAYWDDEQKRCYEFVTNLMEIEVDYIPLLYKCRWQIELLFKRLKQNFMFRYFLGDNENAIKVQIWCCLIANLLLEVIFSKVKEKRKAFSHLVNFVRLHITSYIDLENYWRCSTDKLIRFIKSLLKGPPSEEVQLKISF